MNIQTVHVDSPDGRLCRARLRYRFSEGGEENCRQAVRAILGRVRKEGDTAVLDYCRRFDSPAMTLETLRVTEEEFAQAGQFVDGAFRDTCALPPSGSTRSTSGNSKIPGC
jgi:histidinol dehydrogenase